jgi:hypothetical protein
MLDRFTRKRHSVVDEPIAKVLTDMNQYGPDSKEYSELVDHLERLMEMKAKERQSRISPDTMAIVAGNLLGILIIVAYEQKHVIRTSGMNFVMKVRNPS